MSSTIVLQHAQRSDIATLADIANAANAKSVLHRRIAPLQDRYPLSYYYWRLNIIRERFATPNQRNIIAKDSSTGEILGLACWAVEGSDSALYKEWTSQSTWADWIEAKLVWAERTWSKYFMDKSIDYKYLKSFMAAFQGSKQPLHPACLRVHLIVVKPSTQSKGVGRMLINWGKELAVKEGLPILLDANLEATGFYEKGGFSRLSEDMLIESEDEHPINLPVFVWEGEGREGRWLERDMSFDGSGERWKWREEVLPESNN